MGLFMGERSWWSYFGCEIHGVKSLFRPTVKTFLFRACSSVTPFAITMFSKAFLRDRGLNRATTKFIKKRLDRIYYYQVLDRLPDFMDAVARGSQDDSLESKVPDGVQESITFSVLKQCRK